MVVLWEEARNSLGFGAGGFKKAHRATEQAEVWKGQEIPDFRFRLNHRWTVPVDQQVGIDSDIQLYQIIERKPFHLVRARIEK
jgi:hypothetical protein